MIVDNGKYYLYRHIRLDKNEVFYVGIGSKYKQSPYKRAYDYWGRSVLWKRISDKTKYEVEIILESDSLSFIKEKEREFIKMYGRINLQTGTLCNLTDGGEGINNIIVSQDTRDKLKERMQERFKKTGNYGLTFYKGVNHPMSKLTEKQVSEIAELITLNESPKNIAEKYNITISVVYDIKNGHKWANITGFQKKNRSPQSNLTVEDVKKIKKLLEDGVSGRMIAKQINTSVYIVSNIKNKKTWKHIN